MLRFGQRFGDGQAETTSSPAVSGLAAVEPLKDALQILRRDAWAAIAHAQRHAFSSRLASDVDRSVRVANRVVDEGQEHPPDRFAFTEDIDVRDFVADDGSMPVKKSGLSAHILNKWA